MQQVLIVESDVTFRGQLAARLRRQRFQIAEASDCDSAIQQLAVLDVGVVLLGVRDDTHAGLESLDALLAVDQPPKVLLLISPNDATLFGEKIACGACDTVDVPYDLRTLVEKIDKALEPELA